METDKRFDLIFYTAKKVFEIKFITEQKDNFCSAFFMVVFTVRRDVYA